MRADAPVLLWSSCTKIVTSVDVDRTVFLEKALYLLKENQNICPLQDSYSNIHRCSIYNSSNC